MTNENIEIINITPEELATFLRGRSVEQLAEQISAMAANGNLTIPFNGGIYQYTAGSETSKPTLEKI